jgi:hypothetical protein
MVSDAEHDMDEDELAVELAAAIADGGWVDWGEMEHQLGLHRMPIAPFRALDAIARAHRTVVPRLHSPSSTACFVIHDGQPSGVHHRRQPAVASVRGRFRG